MNKLKRYIIFLIGLFINSLGVSLITKASLGTSPISSIPYVLSLNFPFTLGNFTIVFSVLLIVLQILILRNNFKMENLLQLPVSVVFGYFIDLTMIMLTFVNPDTYVMKVIDLLIGCLILGFGVYMEVLANVVMLPGESFVRAVTDTWHTEFGITKIIFDCSMAVGAIILSLVFKHSVEGVREGTIIAALLVGFIARTIGRWLEPVKPMIFPEKFKDAEGEATIGDANSKVVNAADGAEAVNSAKKAVDGVETQAGVTDCREVLTAGILARSGANVIAIGRQYGSGGHEIGKMIAQKLGYEFYDEELIQMTAGTTGYTPEFIREKEEMMTNSLIYDLVNHMYNYSSEYDTPKDKIYEAENKLITELAETGNCVIVGHCADYMLRNNKNCLRVFLQASQESRIKRVMERENLLEHEAKQKVQKEDRWRADNYRYYTRQIWSASANYQVTLDTDLGYEYVRDMICGDKSNL